MTFPALTETILIGEFVFWKNDLTYELINISADALDAL
jgi:hypothetical protein